MLGARQALGRVAVEPFHPVVQGAGRAWRMAAAVFSREVDQSPALRATVHLYLQVSISQLATTAACCRFHQLESRLARWLLMTQDRAGSETFDVTQKLLALMLGVRRAGVTTSAAGLQRRGLIHYRRGVLTVVNRVGLLDRACVCYEADRKVYSRMLS
jgi:CRP-like cAMP-binding protein